VPQKQRRRPGVETIMHADTPRFRSGGETRGGLTGEVGREERLTHGRRRRRSGRPNAVVVVLSGGGGRCGGIAATVPGHVPGADGAVVARRPEQPAGGGGIERESRDYGPTQAGEGA